jgi:halocyanin-like protein
MSPRSRRWFLQSAAVATALGLAGCSGGGDGDDDDDGLSGDDYPTIDEWLTETDIGDADSNYDGTFVDMREEDEVTIEVGAEGNDGYYAYAPAAVVVSTGTDVVWEWTGEGEAHNVEAIPAEQLGESDYEFSSGEAVEGSDIEYTYTMDEAGIALYHCEPHLPLGMKGGIAVE